MAKKTKIASKAEIPGSEYSPRMHIDFDDVTEVAGLVLGDQVRLVVKGKVRSIEQRKAYDDEKKQIASICLEDFEAEIVPAGGQFDDLLADEDD